MRAEPVRPPCGLDRICARRRLDKHSNEQRAWRTCARTTLYLNRHSLRWGKGPATTQMRQTLLWGTANPEGMENNYQGIFLNKDGIRSMVQGCKTPTGGCSTCSLIHSSRQSITLEQVMLQHGIYSRSVTVRNGSEGYLVAVYSKNRSIAARKR
jgi:hypothetical protein